MARRPRLCMISVRDMDFCITHSCVKQEGIPCAGHEAEKEHLRALEMLEAAESPDAAKVWLRREIADAIAELGYRPRQELH